ncbi:ATP-dependent DNA damage sensor [Malassezia pachydermatis]
MRRAWASSRRLGVLREFHATVAPWRIRSKSVSDLPTHIPISLSPVSDAEVPPTPTEWPPLALGVLENMRAFPQCILLTRVGGFYESYFEQAPTLASLLGIKLATRKWAGQRIPMAGFPIFQLDKYLKVLVQDHGQLVAICEEFKTDDRSLPFDRRVTRVVSPGTLIDERFLDPFHNNFILAITEQESGSYGLAWLDVSTADFQTAVSEDDKSLRDEVARIAPREIVLEGAICPPDHAIWDATDRISTSVARIPTPVASTTQTYMEHAWISEAERKTISLLTAYLQTRLMEHMPSLEVGLPHCQKATQVMHIDAATLNALEIRETNERSARGSLVSILRRTVTQGGARLLVQWLTSPSTNIPLIRARHAMVELFLRSAFLRQDVRTMMRGRVGDVLRTLQRISLRRNDVQDLLEIRDFIQVTDEITSCLAGSVAEPIGGAELQEILSRFTSLHALGQRLEAAIDEGVMEKRMRQQEVLLQAQDALYHGGVAPVDAQEPQKKRRTKRSASASLVLEEESWGDAIEHLIRPSSSPLLQTLTDEYNVQRQEARKLENDLRTMHDEPVTLKFLQGQGHVVHFPSSRGTVDASLSLAYKTKTTRTFYHAQWSRIGMKLQKLKDQLTECESRLLEALRLEVLEHTTKLRRNARLVDQLDVLLGFAQAAEELSLVRPTIDDSYSFNIQGGRHLGVEMGLLEQERLFTKNDLELGDTTRLHLITGPNMGGKSTFLRQNALITVLAQAGSFVPANAARIGVVDAIFSRVGAKDDLFHSRSTFMVEMAETADILHRATPRSFVIADEIGRGTNTSVGLSVAFSTLYTLAMKIQCRSLFATHYYELADMLGYQKDVNKRPLQAAVDFFCTRLEQREGTFLFSHHVRPGVNQESHGLAVAHLAGMPLDTMDLATRMHEWLVRHGHAHIRTAGLMEDLLPPIEPTQTS